MGISRGGIYKPSELMGQAEVIDDHIGRSGAKFVLELGGGRGANSIWLARRHLEVKFVSLDFSETQTNLARRAGRGLPNFEPVIGDFQDLTRFRGKALDLVFSVESVCHSFDKQKLLSEVFEILRADDCFIDFDGYRGKPTNQLSNDESLAAKMVERGMSVGAFDEYTDFCQKARSVGFLLEEEENLSPYVIPTMQRFEALAGKFFRRPRLARPLSKIPPTKFTYNAISGFLMPSLMEAEVFQYWMSCFKKPAL